jgi:predicted ribosome quality control (RQC) complex YloA/Tae2 family protein
MPHQPAPFAMLLRKHLSNARIEEISQIGFDRVIRIVFDAKMGRRELIIECFRNGNLILLDENCTIIAPLTHSKSSDRVIKKGAPYLPPSGTINPVELTKNTLMDILNKSEINLVKTLATQVNLGGQQAELLCKTAEIDSQKSTKEIIDSDDEFERIFEGLMTLIGDLKNNNSGGYLSLKTEEIEQTESEIENADGLLARDEIFSRLTFEASPVKPLENENVLNIHFDSLNQAIDTWHGRHDSGATARRIHEKMLAEQPKGMDTDADKLTRRLESQQKSLEKFDNEIEENRNKGLAIQENAQNIDYLIDQANQTINEYGWKEFSKKATELEYISKVDQKEKRIFMKLPNDVGNVWISVENSAQLNAQVYYAKAKKVKDKSEGAREALIETKKLLKRAEKTESKRQESNQVTVIKRAKRFWFERHRWTIIDGMHLFVGGRDAKSNDTLIKKHMKKEDLYFHADLHGAASCISKLKIGFEIDSNPPPYLPSGIQSYRICDSMENSEFSNEAINQSANMALIWSRGWTGGGGAGTTFWVKPGQVSKTAETGEFVAKGAFIVRGNRNWIKGLEMKMAIGLICINGVPLLLGGTNEIVSTLCPRWAEIQPSRNKKDVFANLISKHSGLTTDDILPILPGPCELKEDHGLLS